MSKFIGQIKLEVVYATRTPAIHRKAAREFWTKAFNGELLPLASNLLNQNPAIHPTVLRCTPIITLTPLMSACRLVSADGLEETFCFFIRTSLELPCHLDECEEQWQISQWSDAASEGLEGLARLLAASTDCHPSMVRATSNNWACEDQIDAATLHAEVV